MGPQAKNSQEKWIPPRFPLYGEGGTIRVHQTKPVGISTLVFPLYPRAHQFSHNFSFTKASAKPF